MVVIPAGVLNVNRDVVTFSPAAFVVVVVVRSFFVDFFEVLGVFEVLALLTQDIMIRSKVSDPFIKTYVDAPPFGAGRATTGAIAAAARMKATESLI